MASWDQVLMLLCGMVDMDDTVPGLEILIEVVEVKKSGPVFIVDCIRLMLDRQQKGFARDRCRTLLEQFVRIKCGQEFDAMTSVSPYASLATLVQHWQDDQTFELLAAVAKQDTRLLGDEALRALGTHWMGQDRTREIMIEVAGSGKSPASQAGLWLARHHRHDIETRSCVGASSSVIPK